MWFCCFLKVNHEARETKKNCAKAKGTVTVAFSIKRTIKNLNSSELFIRLNIDYITNYAMYFFFYNV
jgi:hypothetical protein